MTWTKEQNRTGFTLLAAGQSSRMKADKALLDFQGRPWISRQVEEIQKSNVISHLVIVDLPQKTENYLKLIQSLESSDFSIQVVENHLENSSPSDSIFCAFDSHSFGQGSFVSPIDVPLQAAVISEICEKKSSDMWAVKPSFQGHGGHPVWLSLEAIGRFKSEPKRLDEFLAQLPKEKVQFIETQSHWTQLNLNTPAEWQEFLIDLRGHRES